jgi:hypothetical protein
MSRRINELEDALRISHALVSQGKHPLLSEALLGIKDIGSSFGDDVNVSAAPVNAFSGDRSGDHTSSPTNNNSPESDADGLIPALGRMSISCGGRSQYSGPSIWRLVRLSALSAMVFG